MNIILATEVIHPGGAETFVLRLSQALKAKGHNVSIFIFYRDYYSQKLYDQWARGVRQQFASIPFPGMLGKIDRLLFRLGIDFSIRNHYIRKSLRKFIIAQKASIIHSHLFKTDNICTTVGDTTGIPVVTTIHGDYLQFYEKDKLRQYIPLLNYAEKAAHNLSKLAGVCCITEKQKRFFEERFPHLTREKLTKIYNGYAAPALEEVNNLRETLGVRASDFVFGMVSRGIPEKGWEAAIRSFRSLGRRDVHLVLVGQSDYLQGLKKQYAFVPGLHFVGHSDNPIEWIRIFDAGLLPTTYASESLPTAVIEYLYCNIPVIATDAGDIRDMLQVGDTKAGIVLPIQDNKLNEADLTQAMECYLSDEGQYESHRIGTGTCFQQFDMEKCIGRYLMVYSEAIGNSGVVVNETKADFVGNCEPKLYA